MKPHVELAVRRMVAMSVPKVPSLNNTEKTMTKKNLIMKEDFTFESKSQNKDLS